ncbi:hypothetical protein BJF79_32000 [Actinomadura sp. CNU-125]|uniref:BlaI/MecI/CopY family transcriptional regulator n=1 Tax=Actinomadura sp. CNU-125 TaxID=1904961 RepID=UPI00095FF73B|nr:BlaI/MecI/CopY family transcriptional regulator [Actinomadura sp. CNU-125]OLT35740.1 hypothetical protein BJF79_32000 [Actinomadura sp. CNU-125]
MRLGELERAVMNELWTRPQGARASDLAAALASGPAHTTVLTILERLARKGLVRREREGRAHRYYALRSKDEHVAGLMSEAFADATDRQSALTHFLDSVSPGDVEVLRQILDGSGEDGREQTR